MLGKYPVVRRWQETDDVLHLSIIRLLTALESTVPENERHFRKLACLQIRRMLIDLARSLSGPHGISTNHGTHYGNRAFYEDLAIDHFSDGSEGSLEDWREFHTCVDLLDDIDREMFDLIWYSGLSTDGVAELLGTTQRSVQRKWRRARLSLAKLHESRTSFAELS